MKLIQGSYIREFLQGQASGGTILLDLLHQTFGKLFVQKVNGCTTCVTCGTVLSVRYADQIKHFQLKLQKILFFEKIKSDVAIKAKNQKLKKLMYIIFTPKLTILIIYITTNKLHYRTWVSFQVSLEHNSNINDV